MKLFSGVNEGQVIRFVLIFLGGGVPRKTLSDGNGSGSPWEPEGGEYLEHLVGGSQNSFHGCFNACQVV